MEIGILQLFEARNGVLIMTYYGHPHGPQIVTNQRHVGGGVLAFAWILAIFTALYMLPWAIAATRGKSNHSSVGLFNLLLGWSVVGWIVALIMSCGSQRAIAASRPTHIVHPQVPQRHY